MSTATTPCLTTVADVAEVITTLQAQIATLTATVESLQAQVNNLGQLNNMTVD